MRYARWWMVLVVANVAGSLQAQDNAVAWSGFSAGYVPARESDNSVQALLISMAGAGKDGNTQVTTGFLAYPDIVGPVTSVLGEEPFTPFVYALDQNYPNPFNGIANVGLTVAEWAHVKVGVYDLLGREVAVLLNERKGPGAYTLQWDSGRATSGVYFVRMEAGSVVRTVKAILVK